MTGGTLPCLNSHVSSVGNTCITVELVEAGRQVACGTWEEDYPALVPSLLDDTDPCYVLYRLDSRDTNGAYRWLFIDYVPDNAHVCAAATIMAPLF
jgi:twinfilin-like protein